MAGFRRELLEQVGRVADTPLRVVLKHAAERRFAAVAAAAARGGEAGPALLPALSVKTNPRPVYLELARSSGFIAEVISGGEALAAREAGFADGAILYNGPRPYRRGGASAPLFAAFADSVEALARYARDEVGRTLGVRLRPPGIASRFGVQPGEFDEVARIVRGLPAERRMGASMHVRSEDYAPRSWLELAGDFVALAERLQAQIGRPLRLLDVGGSWSPRMLDRVFERDFPALQALVRERLREVESIVFEPGQSLLTECEALVCSVIEIRPRRGEIVVDAGFSDVPHLQSYPHRLFWLRAGTLEPVERGASRILGPLCLEYDIVASDVRLPQPLAPGDRLVIADCGSYDASMSFSFARGPTTLV